MMLDLLSHPFEIKHMMALPILTPKTTVEKQQMKNSCVKVRKKIRKKSPCKFLALYLLV